MYVLHDTNAKTNERVAWIIAQNLHSDPDTAWFKMYETARNQGQLKANAGLSARGRKNDKPVLHYTLAWHADDKPTAEQMKAAALDSLEVLGLSEHEALIVAHDDKKHPHVHIVANTIHPYTGRTAALKFSKERLSEWAENYEREHGRIRCEERVKNNEQRREIREARKRESLATKILGTAGIEIGPAPYIPVKDKSPNRPRWFEKKEVVDRMKRLRAELDIQQKAERTVSGHKREAERVRLVQNTESAIDKVHAQVKERFRPQWRNLYRQHRQEQTFVQRSASHPLERAVFVFTNRHRLFSANPMTFRGVARLVLSGKRFSKAVANLHLKERRTMGRAERAEIRALSDRISASHRERFYNLVARHAEEREAEHAHHGIERKGITFARAKGQLIDEIENSPPPRLVPRLRRQHPEPTQEFNEAASGTAAAQMSRADEIRRQMEAWRRQNPSRDFGREL